MGYQLAAQTRELDTARAAGAAAASAMEKVLAVYRGIC